MKIDGKAMALMVFQGASVDEIVVPDGNDDNGTVMCHLGARLEFLGEGQVGEVWLGHN